MARTSCLTLPTPSVVHSNILRVKGHPLFCRESFKPPTSPPLTKPSSHPLNPPLLSPPPFHPHNPKGFSPLCSLPPISCFNFSLSAASAAFLLSILPAPTPKAVPNAPPLRMTPPSSGSTTPPTGPPSFSSPLPATLPTGESFDSIVAPMLLP